jgi:hypothetical protein
MSEFLTLCGCAQSDEELVDVTLSSEGKSIRAHKIILSACSQYFRHVFKVILTIFQILFY